MRSVPPQPVFPSVCCIEPDIARTIAMCISLEPQLIVDARGTLSAGADQPLEAIGSTETNQSNET